MKTELKQNFYEIFKDKIPKEILDKGLEEKFSQSLEKIPLNIWRKIIQN